MCSLPLLLLIILTGLSSECFSDSQRAAEAVVRQGQQEQGDLNRFNKSANTGSEKPSEKETLPSSNLPNTCRPIEW